MKTNTILKKKFKNLIVFLLFFIFLSCGEGFNVSNTNNNFNNNENNSSNKETLIPIIKTVENIKLIPENQIYKDDKIVKNNQYTGEIRSESLKVCRDSNDTGFLFDYMTMYLDHYLGGRQRIHLENKEPLDVGYISEMDALLPFTQLMKINSTMTELTRRVTSSLNFGSYISVSDAILEEIIDAKVIEPNRNNQYLNTGYFFMNSLQISKSNPINGVFSPFLYFKNENSISCLPVASEMFETFNDGEFGFGICNNCTSSEEAPHFYAYYKYEAFNNNGSESICGLRNHLSFNRHDCSSCHILDIECLNDCLDEGYNAWHHNTWQTAGYWSMEYNIIPEKNHSLIYNTTSEEFENEDKFNLIVTENRLPDIYNPNSYLIHFPMKPIRVTDGKYYDAIINFKNLDLISNLSFNGIIQSAQVENRMKDKLFKYFETQKSSCKSIYDLETKNVSNFLCQTRYYNHHFNDNLNDEFKYLYNLKRKCYDFLKNKTEDELLSSFQEFSIHPRDIPINDNQEKYFDSLGDYQKCIYQAWTSYNPETIVKIEEYDGRIYNWSPFDETMPFRKKIGASCISQNNCDFQKSRLSNNEDPILACENQFGFCSNSVECHDDDSKCFINTDKSGYGMKCDKHFCEVSYEDAENHFFNMSDNQRIIYKQNIKNYSIDIDSDKLGENVLYLGGSIDTYNTLIGYNYYRFARAKKSCDNCEPLDCNKHSDCDILKESNKVQYGCYDVSQDISSGLPAINHTEESISICSTPLSTIVNESKTIGESNGFELWFRANLIGSINTEDWNEGKNYLGIEFDTIFFSVIRQNSKTVLVDTFTYDNQHEATILNLNDIEGVPKIVTTYIINSMLDPSSQLSKALIFANIFDTKLKIFENINDKFDSLKYNLLSWIDKVFPADGVNGNLLKDISNIDDILSSNGLTISQ